MSRKLVFGSLLALVAVLAAAPVAADDHEDGDKFTLSGEVRTRWDYSANIFDADDDGDDGSVFSPFADVDDDFDLWPYRVRIAADGSFTDHVSAKVEFQGFGFFGDDSPASTLGHAIGQAYSNNALSFDNDSEIDLYQGYVELAEIGDSNWSLRLGRQEYTLGNELHFGDLDFYNGTSFDGARATADFESFNLDLFFLMIDEVPGALTATDFDTQVEVWGGTVDFDIGDTGQMVEPYVFFTRNTASGASRARVYTLGALYGRPEEEGEEFDWSAEAAYQTGDVGPSGSSELDVSAWIVEGWFGWSFSEAHRVHVGALIASGDDSLDGDAEAWIPLFPDNHANNRLGDIDLFGGPSVGSDNTGGGISNVTDLNVGYRWSGDRQRFMASIHNLTLTEEVTIGSDDEDDIGNEFDLVYDYDYSENVGFQVGYAHLVPGDLLDADFNGSDDADDVMRAWWQLRLTWN